MPACLSWIPTTHVCTKYYVYASTVAKFYTLMRTPREVLRERHFTSVTSHKHDFLRFDDGVLVQVVVGSVVYSSEWLQHGHSKRALPRQLARNNTIVRGWLRGVHPRLVKSRTTPLDLDTEFPNH